MKKYLFLLAFLSLTFSSVSLAQTNMFSFNYAISLPTGNTADYIDQASGRGFTFEYQRFVNSNLAIGFELGHTTLYKREANKVYTEGTASLSGVQYRYQYQYPILVTANYFVVTGGPIRPYVGLGIGTVAHDRRIDMGIYTSENTHWQFAIRPEAGLLIQPTSQSLGFKIGAKYYSSFESNDLAGQSQLGFNIGIVFIN